MTIEEVRQIIEPYIDQPIVNFEIDLDIFNEVNGRERFNEIIRQNVDNKVGVYIWVDSLTREIVYIGMAGKIKTDGSLGNHSIQNRLLASRGKDRQTKKDIQTNDYVKNFMSIQNIDRLTFYIIYSTIGEPPAFIEALLLYKFYKQNDRLPKLNNSF